MPQSITVVTVAARVADIYDFLARERSSNSELLIRAYHNRQVKNSDGEEVERLQSAIAKIPVAGQISLDRMSPNGFPTLSERFRNGLGTLR